MRVHGVERTVSPMLHKTRPYGFGSLGLVNYVPGGGSVPQVVRALTAATVQRSTATPKSPIPHLMYLYLS
jgi:hypothetical protein